MQTRDEFLDVLFNKTDHMIQNTAFIDNALLKQTHNQDKIIFMRKG